MSAVVAKWINRLSSLQILLPLMLVLGMGVLIVYPRVTSSNAKLQAVSPDGRMTAEVDTSSGGGATETAYTGVRVRSRLNPFRHYVFGGLDYGAKITISWIDSKNLLIKCHDCGKFDGKTKEQSWNGIAIHYEMD